MNITGEFYIAKAGYWDNGSYANGAFTARREGIGNSANQHADYGTKVKLNATDQWTGSTSEAGSGKAFSIMNPYRAVYIWRRIESKA